MASLTVNSAYNIGTDLSATISDPYGDVFPVGTLGNLMTMNINFDMEMLKVVPISNGGVPIYLSVPNGLSGTMEFVRFNGAMTSMFTSLYQAFYNEGLLPQFTMTIVVLNRSGTTDEYVIPNMVFHRPDFGEFSRITEVNQRLEFSAPTIQSTTGAAGLLAALPLTGVVGGFSAVAAGL